MFMGGCYLSRNDLAHTPLQIDFLTPDGGGARASR